VLARYDPDALRYYLTINMPELHDSDWDWGEFVARNNGELLANWGNLVNRVLSFSYKNWDGCVPDIDESTLRPADLELLATIEAGFQSVGALLEAVKLRPALEEAFRLSSTGNQYLSENAPWHSIKTDRKAAALTIYTALKAIDSLRVLFAPFLPFSSEKLNGFFAHPAPIFGESFTESITDSLGDHNVLRYKPAKAGGQWEPSNLKPGAKLNQPSPLYKLLDQKVVEEERARLSLGQ
jgi:methionyl-tRNA synthetase